MRIWFVIIVAGLAATGCASKTNAQLREQNAYLSGQNSILMQQRQAQPAADNTDNTPSVTIIGQVQNGKVPWVTGLTLSQAIATANYTGADQPKQIVITRNGETASVDVNALMNGATIPLEAGDVIEIK